MSSIVGTCRKLMTIEIEAIVGKTSKSIDTTVSYLQICTQLSNLDPPLSQYLVSADSLASSTAMY